MSPSVVIPIASSTSNLHKTSAVILPKNALTSTSQTKNYGWRRSSSGPHTNDRNGRVSVSSSSDVVGFSESPSVCEKIKISEVVPPVCKNDTLNIPSHNSAKPRHNASPDRYDRKPYSHYHLFVHDRYGGYPSRPNDHSMLQHHKCNPLDCRQLPLNNRYSEGVVMIYDIQ